MRAKLTISVTWMLCLFAFGAHSQSLNSSNSSRELYRERYNDNVLFLMGGQVGGTFSALTTDIAKVLNEDGRVRVLPVIGGAGSQSVKDLLLLRGIDLSIIIVENLNELKASQEFGPGIENQIAYITALVPLEAHLLVRKGIQSLEDLRGKKVNFNNRESMAAKTGPMIFETLGIKAREIYVSQPDALELMGRGELDATFCLCARPAIGWPAIPKNLEYKLLSIPFLPSMQASYLPAILTNADYPNLIGPDEKVETMAVMTILATFNWPKGSTRYKRTAKFVDALFSRITELHKPPRHPGWASVNLAATVPGWTRYPAAQDWLDQKKSGPVADVQNDNSKFRPPLGRDGKAEEASASGDAPRRDQTSRKKLEAQRETSP